MMRLYDLLFLSKPYNCSDEKSITQSTLLLSWDIIDVKFERSITEDCLAQLVWEALPEYEIWSCGSVVGTVISLTTKTVNFFFVLQGCTFVHWCNGYKIFLWQTTRTQSYAMYRIALKVNVKNRRVLYRCYFINWKKNYLMVFFFN